MRRVVQSPSSHPVWLQGALEPHNPNKNQKIVTLSPPLTPYQSQYVAWLLSRRMNADSADLLAFTLAEAQIDLNPHQVEAALFAFHSPLSKGVILADEVGLGKNIEAGLVTVAATREEKLHWQKRQRELENKCNQLRRKIFDRQRNRLINELEGRWSRETTTTAIFKVQWELV